MLGLGMMRNQRSMKRGQTLMEILCKRYINTSGAAHICILAKIRPGLLHLHNQSKFYLLGMTNVTGLLTFVADDLIVLLVVLRALHWMIVVELFSQWLELLHCVVRTFLLPVLHRLVPTFGKQCNFFIIEKIVFGLTCEGNVLSNLNIFV